MDLGAAGSGHRCNEGLLRLWGWTRSVCRCLCLCAALHRSTVVRPRRAIAQEVCGIAGVSLGLEPVWPSNTWQVVIGKGCCMAACRSVALAPGDDGGQTQTRRKEWNVSCWRGGGSWGGV